MGTRCSCSDLVIACTGAAAHVITRAMVADALALRAERAASPLVLLDLALPRDVETEAGRLAGVRLIDLEAIGAAHAGEEPTGQGQAGLAGATEVAAVRLIVAQELARYLKADREASVAPTVVALRAKAALVVESELARLERRLGDLDARTRGEIALSLGRLADKLLHGPTVRVKELAGAPGADSYEAALRVLFELDPDAVDAVARADDDLLTWPLREASE